MGTEHPFDVNMVMPCAAKAALSLQGCASKQHVTFIINQNEQQQLDKGVDNLLTG
jgi:hypothetical protein